ncbi:MAG: tRNA (adenosine(37)-N6)-dimethylallyltransferase MiaA [Patescibacteria group bacterium]|nr:tRNA (adenosine(37)-N6)-dimethylallyltransferase MiaA [Patescibacteria group bacterium]MDD5490294.1 tRNA (adenosine(37)-N6)-dimethylallyltransferase MiaA [Patescibacteria group bacterium]
MSILPKIIVILGPTASGKTGLSLKLAKKFKGEIISADSRQVYKYMNIGTAKEPGKWEKIGGKKVYVAGGIRHYVIDFLEPDKIFSAGSFKKEALKNIYDILKRGKMPFIAGGTGLYISAIADNLSFAETESLPELRQDLEKKTLGELVKLLKKFDLKAYKKIDLKNKRRVVRALEVAMVTGKSFVEQRNKGKKLFNVLKIGIKMPREKLYDRINKRVDEQIKAGLLQETKKLVKKGFGWGLPAMSGIGYKQMGMYLRGEVSWDEAVRILKRDTRHYARRQMIWWRKDKRIKWAKDYKKAERLVKRFLAR